MALWGGFLGLLMGLVAVGGWVGRAVALALFLIAVFLIAVSFVPRKGRTVSQPLRSTEGKRPSDLADSPSATFKGNAVANTAIRASLVALILTVAPGINAFAFHYSAWCYGLAMLLFILAAVCLVRMFLMISRMDKMRKAYGYPANSVEPTEIQIRTRSDLPQYWKPFDDGEMWIPGALLWLWNASWKEPRLAIASPDDDEMGDWVYSCGEKLGSMGEPWPTHCCRPLAPTPPATASSSTPQEKTP